MTTSGKNEKANPLINRTCHCAFDHFVRKIGSSEREGRVDDFSNSTSSEEPVISFCSFWSFLCSKAQLQVNFQE